MNCDITRIESPPIASESLRERGFRVQDISDLVAVKSSVTTEELFKDCVDIYKHRYVHLTSRHHSLFMILRNNKENKEKSIPSCSPHNLILHQFLQKNLCPKIPYLNELIYLALLPPKMLSSQKFDMLDRCCDLTPSTPILILKVEGQLYLCFKDLPLIFQQLLTIPRVQQHFHRDDNWRNDSMCGNPTSYDVDIRTRVVTFASLHDTSNLFFYYTKLVDVFDIVRVYCFLPFGISITTAGAIFSLCLLIIENSKSIIPTKAAMARPTIRRNRFFWELVVAFMLVVSAAVFQTFHFFNNAWLVQTNGSYIYQRGLGDDCVKNEEFLDGIRCTGWLNNKYNTFVINGQNLTASDVVPPSIGLKMARVFMIFSMLLYLVVIFSLFFTCVKRDLKMQKLLCGVTVLLISINLFIIFLVLVDSSEPFIKTMKYCSLGSAFYNFLLSYLLLWIGSAVHFDSWIDVYDDMRTNDLSIGLFNVRSRNMNYVGVTILIPEDTSEEIFGNLSHSIKNIGINK
ncbi:Tumor necrosis factor [Dirofilaria immitis]